MADSRSNRAKKNIVVSLLCQMITLVCGFVVPRTMIGAFGSEAYGATASITQFLAYITLLEGGVGGVARAVLYKPLAEEDRETIHEIMAEVRRFFRVVAWIFAAYVLILACCFKSVSKVDCLDWITTFVLVIVISLSTFGQYFIGISNAVLLQAAQRAYITNAISIGATVLNTVSVLALVYLGCDLVMVKLVSSCIFFLRPVLLWWYVRRYFGIQNTPVKKGKVYLTQKWHGLGQHIAYFLHSNTDVAILTIFANLQSVAVYSVYHMVTGSIQNIAASFVSGMEAVFGDMLAREEYDQLHNTFGFYETLVSVFSMILFAVTAVLITPFVRLYTAGITDADYIQPLFGMLLVLASVLYCLRMPYHALVIAAGHFRQTSVAAYGEAIVNVGVSMVLVMRYGLVGVAIGTIAATGLRFIYYVYYLSGHIFGRRIGLFAKRLLVNTAAFCVAVILGGLVIDRIEISGYLIWAGCGLLVTAVSSVTVTGLNLIFYRSDVMAILKMLRRKR